MEWNGVRLNEYQPGPVEWAKRGLGSMFWTLFFLSPNAFLPYLAYRAVDNTPGPFLYVALIAVTGGVGVYYATRYGFSRLYQWKKKSGGFAAGATVTLASLVYFCLRVWIMKAGVERATRSWHVGPELAMIVAAVYAILVLHANLKSATRHRF